MGPAESLTSVPDVAGSFVADPDPSQMNSWPALPAGVPDLRAEPTLQDSASIPTAVALPDLLPLAALPQSFQDALAPLAEYWQVVGMAFGGPWPEPLDSYIAQDAFGEVVSHAEDLVAILLEDTPQCPVPVAELDRIRHRLGAGAREAAATGGTAPPTVRLSAPLHPPQPPAHREQPFPGTHHLEFVPPEHMRRQDESVS